WPNPKFYQKSIQIFDRRATGKLDGTTGAYRHPSPLPDGRLLVSYAAAPTDLTALDETFEIVIVDPITGSRTGLISSDRDLAWPVAVYAKGNHGIFESRPDEANGTTRVYTDADRRDRAQITILDLPLLASLLFQNTRSERLIPDPGRVEVWENLPPEPGVRSYDDGGEFVESDAFGKYYLRRRRLGVPEVYSDGSASILIN